MASKVPYPHMLPHDVALFSSFVLTDRGRQFTAWAFDLHLGIGEATAGWPDHPTSFDIGRYLTQLRIDAIGWQDDIPTIIEVKPNARLSALGQLLAYCFEWREAEGYECRRAVVTDYVNRQTRRIYEHFHIDVYEVPEASAGEIVLAKQWVDRLPTRYG